MYPSSHHGYDSDFQSDDFGFGQQILAAISGTIFIIVNGRAYTSPTTITLKYFIFVIFSYLLQFAFIEDLVSSAIVRGADYQDIKQVHFENHIYLEF